MTQRVDCDLATAWELVTDIDLPARCSPELQSVEWVGGADGVTVGARFRGSNQREAMGTWHTECEVDEVDEGCGTYPGPRASWRRGPSRSSQPMTAC